MSEPLLEVRHLTVRLRSSRGVLTAVREVDLTVGEGEAVGVVGESGSGKTTLLRAILGLLPAHAEIVEGEIIFRGRDLRRMRRGELRKLRGAELAMVFQDSLTALDPIMRVGDQIAEAPRTHLGQSKSQARATALRLMAEVGIPDPPRRMRAYPHELSGGMRQRVVIATALSCGPKLLLCDEPTTALDVTIQDQILRLMRRLTEEIGAGMLYVTHDLPVIAQLCARVAVMYAGQLVEVGPVVDVFSRPRHPYTRGLLASVPAVQIAGLPLTSIPGSPPDLADLPDGCPFQPRCGFAQPDCLLGTFPLVDLSETRASACTHHELLDGLSDLTAGAR